MMVTVLRREEEKTKHKTNGHNSFKEQNQFDDRTLVEGNVYL